MISVTRADGNGGVDGTGNDAGAPNGAFVLILGPLLVSAVVAAVVLAALRPSAIRRRRCRGYVDLTRASRRI